MADWQQWEETKAAGVTHARGFRAAGVRCGLKTESDDLALIACDTLASVAGVFTTNRVQASSVVYSRRVAEGGQARAILCNAGNANACNGPRGMADTERMAALAARELGAEPGRVLVASTGIIGHPLPMEKLEDGVPRAAAALARGPAADATVARAIMTTDTRPKQFAVECRAPQWSGPVRIGGVCKGSGMIAPNMATMLCFLTTDAEVAPDALRLALHEAVRTSFNRTTVDGDTSTNDMVLLLASGASGVRIDGAAMDAFVEALGRVCRHLAREVARDGEGATKLVEVVVRGAATEADADRIGRTIAESPLVKTALFGCDPNWGRILMAAGRSGAAFDPDCATVRLGDIVVFERGQRAPFDAQAAHAYLKQPEVTLTVDCGDGRAAATFYTCDYSYDYIRINAEYHT